MAQNSEGFVIRVDSRDGGGWLKQLIGVPHHTPVIVLSHLREEALHFDSEYAARDATKMLKRLGYKVTRKSVVKGRAHDEH